jgi:DNA-binding response OmpR family regulator
VSNARGSYRRLAMRHSAHLRLYKGIPAPTSDAQLNAEGTPLAVRASEPGGLLQLLIIEENARFAVTLRATFETEGFVVAVAATVSQARQQMLDTPPAFVIIDTMAPSHDSYELLRTLRASGNDVPVIVLTTHGDEHDKLRGFWLGADDCITKPVNPLELVARIRVLLRRAHPAFAAPLPRWLRFGDVEINPAARVVKLRGVLVDLRPKEFDLLLALYRQHDRVISRAELLRDVWGYHASTVSRTVDTHMAGLRLKLEDDPLAPRHLVTLWTAGYVLRLEAEPK